jgi:hypothetical protein
MLILMLKLAREEKPIGFGVLPLCHVFASACDTVWGWGNPTLNSILEGGGGWGGEENGLGLKRKITICTHIIYKFWVLGNPTLT